MAYCYLCVTRGGEDDGDDDGDGQMVIEGGLGVGWVGKKRVARWW